MFDAPRYPRYPVRLTGLLLLVCSMAGCGGKYTPVPVSGVVTLDGKPVEGATVYFYPVGDEREGRPATGNTDKNGEYRLSTMKPGDGALRREYRIVVHKNLPTIPNLKIPDFPKTPEGRIACRDFMYNTFEAKGIQPFKNALPRKYGDSNSTPLTCKVTGAMTVPLDLTSK